MLKFAFDAITSFSYKPLKLASIFGTLLSSLSFIYLVVVICTKIFATSHIQPGWASILAVNLLFHGLTLIILGIVGEYIGRIYDEAKGRPLYIVRETKNFSDEKEHKITGRM